MNTYIALLRGINVGGHNKLPMKELVQLLEDLGLHNVKTYIQTGNVAFKSEKDSAKLAESIKAAIEKDYGFAPHVLVLTFNEFQKAMTSNPFPEAEAEPKTLHLYFLDREPENPDLESLESIKKDSERFILKNKTFYLHAPEGVGRSKLAAKVEKVLGVPATARNWRSVGKIKEMAEQIER
ncbi:MAG TPA: DUF1697 domain-containing protein [Balneolaceae bacterium]|nr:DUF1697 domain-containing protein [Balneolaceae bacterium]